MKEIETENIILRKFMKKDAKEAFENWAGIPSFADISDFAVHSNVEETEEIIEKGLGDSNADQYTMAIIFKDVNQLAGFIRISEISLKNKTCKINFLVGKKWTDAGKEDLYAEAIKKVTSLLIRDGFNVVTYVYKDISENNKRNISIIEKAGFEEEAVLHKRIIDLKTGEKKDKIFFSKIAEK